MKTQSDVFFTEQEIRELIVRESLKPTSRMNMKLIMEGLDYFYPFDEKDDRRTRLAWADFNARYDLNSIRTKARKQARHLRIALIILILLALGGAALAFGSRLWTIYVEWTSHDLVMSMEPASDAGIDEPSSDAPIPHIAEVWGDDIYDVMTENGISIMLPLWIPEGFGFVSVESMDYGDGITISAQYETTDGRLLALAIRDFRQEDLAWEQKLAFEADENLQEVYPPQGSEEHFIMSNLDRYSLAWIDGSCSVFIMGDLTYDEVIQMIQSMYDFKGG